MANLQGAGSVVRGFLKSRGQRREREREDALTKAQVDLFKLQLEEAKAKKAAQERLRARMSGGMPGSPMPSGPNPAALPPAASGAPTGAPQGQQGLASMLSDQGMLMDMMAAGMDPSAIAKMLQIQNQPNIGDLKGTGFEVTGGTMSPSGTSYQFGMPKAGKVVETVGPDGRPIQIMLDEFGRFKGFFNPKADIREIEQTLPSGEVRTQFQNINAPGSMGGFVKEPAQNQRDLKGDELTRYVLPDGRTPTEGSQASIKAAGGVPVSAADKEKISKTKSALNMVEALARMGFGDGQGPGLFAQSTAFGPAIKGGENWLARVGKQDPELAARVSAYQDFAEGTVGLLIKSLGESGALSGGDVTRAKRLLAEVGGEMGSPLAATEKEAILKFQELYTILGKGMTDVIGDQAILPPSIIPTLKPNMPATPVPMQSQGLPPTPGPIGQAVGKAEALVNKWLNQ